ncbi:transmembrane protein 126A [Stegostoma tigrinum]|uniref:transmembrane protein 126A n=1 Tax=Stegostoma tigrinum TaxID=3053191 RepID=UPI00202AE3F9|nr:transmembrane protein 126A [Stegostoma tigrinum]XP_048389201.1 transmembrane protein 126A [Stegostoma tigrinum]
MAANTLFTQDLQPGISKQNVMEMLLERFQQLPELDRKFFSYGPIYLGINSAFAGLIANSFFRRILNIAQARFASSLPMGILPFLTTVAGYNAAVSKPLLSGDINCPTCALVRGGLVASLGGGLYPVLLALPINAGLALRYNTAPMPQRGNILRFWITVCQPVMRKLSFILILQTLFGVYLSSKHYAIYMKMLSLPPTHTDPELNA